VRHWRTRRRRRRRRRRERRGPKGHWRRRKGKRKRTRRKRGRRRRRPAEEELAAVPPLPGSQGLEQHSAAAFELAPARYPEDAVGRVALSIAIALPWVALADADVPMWCCEGPRQAP
jgi:hypothetical protein